jgi:hypothetical protein
VQAYIDESSKDGLYVMAGYLALPEQWSALADDWSQLLGLGPPHFRQIHELKMSDMTTPLGLEQCELFYRVIEKYVVASASCCVKLHDLRAAYEKIAWPSWIDNLDIATNEHYNAFEAIVKGIALNSHMVGVAGPVDICFDEHSSRVKCLHGWRVLRQGGHPAITSMLGRTPEFKDSKSVPGLQAADLLAYWIRTAAQVHSSRPAEFSLTFPWSQKRQIPGVHIYFEPAMIERNFKNIVLACSLARYGVRPEVVSAIVSP